MKRAKNFYDVYLSASKLDAGLANVVRGRFEEAGLTVFTPERDLKPGDAVHDLIREAIADSRTFVVILTPTSVNSANLAVEYGGAWAWNKPTYILLNGLSGSEVPVFLKRHRAYPISRLSRVVTEVTRAASPLSEPDLKLLSQLYQQGGVPTERLATEPASLDSLAEGFNRLSSSKQSPERLLSELMRLRMGSKTAQTSQAAGSAEGLKSITAPAAQ